MYFTICYCNTITVAWLPFFFLLPFLNSVASPTLSHYLNVPVTLRCQRAASSSCAFCPMPLLYCFLCGGWAAPVAGEDVNKRYEPNPHGTGGDHCDLLVSCCPLVGVTWKCITVTHCRRLYILWISSLSSCWGRRHINCSGSKSNIPERCCHSWCMCVIQTTEGYSHFLLIYTFLFFVLWMVSASPMFHLCPSKS